MSSPPRRLLLVTVLLAAAVLVATVVIPVASRFGAQDVEASSKAGTLLSLLNQSRANNGLAPLSYASDLTAVAQARAQTMARQGALSHTPNLGSGICCWSWIAENVAYAGSVRSLHSVLINSPDHRANMMNADADDVGVAVVSSGGTLWAAQVFRARSDSRSSSASSPSRDDDRTAPSTGGSTGGTSTGTDSYTYPDTTSSGTTTSSGGDAVPTLSPAELRRQQLREALRSAREDLRESRRKNGPFDPVRAAVRYSGTLDQVSR